ncbi:MAG: redoxin family protein [Planctomycetota bacterium]|nr:redoxin family protein [Planctomycetota bacterium]
MTLAASGVSFFPATMIAQENTLRQSNNIESISLEKINGEMQSVGTLSDKPYLAVIFLGTECPLVKIYLPKLGMISESFQDLVDVIGVNANSQDTRKEVNTFVKNNKISFPVYKDPKGQLATALGATRTPEALIINRQGDILYRGRIDDQYGVGYARDAPGKEYLKEAFKQLRQGQPISIPRTEAVGCFIGRNYSSHRRSGSVTYQNRIAAIMDKHCIECHREGEIGPFSLTNYDDVAAWSETIG